MEFLLNFIIFATLRKLNRKKNLKEEHMENEDFDMSLFENNDLDLNYNDFSNEDLENEDEDTSDDIKDTTVDGDENNQEEVDGEEDEQDEGDEDKESDSDDSSSNLYSSVIAVLHEQGLLPSLDIENNKIETADDFVEAFKVEQFNQARAMAEEYLNNLDIESIQKSKAEIQNLDSLDEESLKENLDQAKQIIYQDYLNQGLDQAKVTRLLNRLIDLGDDAIVEEAKDSLVSLKEFNMRKIEFEKEAYEKQLEENRKEQERVENEIKKNIFERKDLIKGYNLNKAVQEKIYKSINEIVGKSPEGIYENKFMRERRMNPIEFETRMYTVYELTDGFKDFSKLTSSGKSSAVNELEKAFKKGSFKDSGAPLWMSDKDSYDIGIGDELNM